MRVFTIAHILHLDELGVEGAGEVRILVFTGTSAQKVGDGAVVSCGVLKGLDGEVEPGLKADLAVVF